MAIVLALERGRNVNKVVAAEGVKITEVLPAAPKKFHVRHAQPDVLMGVARAFEKAKNVKIIADAATAKTVLPTLAMDTTHTPLLSHILLHPPR
jgi:predicted nuclease with RNAse H fold